MVQVSAWRMGQAKSARARSVASLRELEFLAGFVRFMLVSSLVQRAVGEYVSQGLSRLPTGLRDAGD